ncbi:MAG: MATE family efflux transporter [Planctomycetota bacterium]|nr:MAG: MATE family efflux transporter [Planctomycetota bacterium]
MAEPEETLPVPGENLPPPPCRSDWLGQSVHSQVFWLALPVLLEQVFIFFVGFYNTYLAGHIEGQQSAATAAICMGAYVSWLANLMFMLSSSGALALVARAKGRNDLEEVNIIAGRAVAIAGMLGLLFAAITIPFAEYFVRLTKLSPEASQIAVRYIRADACGEIFTALTLAGTAVCRGMGQMKVPLAILMAVSLLNVGFSTAMVYGIGPFPAMGVDGIVGGTVIARIGGGLLTLAFLFRGFDGLKLRVRELRLNGPHVARMTRIAIPALIDGLIAWSAHFTFVGVISQLGDTAFAAHYIGVDFEAITYLPATAWGAAAATAIGQSLGAGDRERAMRCGHAAALQCLPVGIIGTLVFGLAGGWVFQVMTSSPQIREVGTSAMGVLACCQIPLVIGIVYIHGLRGAGETRLPLILAIVSTAGLRVPIAWLFGIAWSGGLAGAWLGMLADVTVRGVLGAGLYSWARWTKLKI